LTFRKISVDNTVSRNHFDIRKNYQGCAAMDQKHAVTALGALAQDTRLELYRLLVTSGPEGLPAGVIAQRLGVLPASLTFHLNQLHHAGLIAQRRVSRQLIYSAEYPAMLELVTYLTENCCGRGVSLVSACEPVAAEAEDADPVRRAARC
jgi:ArsR family transcriptional regulator